MSAKHSIFRVLFAVGFMLSINLYVLTIIHEYAFWQDVFMGLPLICYGLAIASRFWPYDGDKK